MTTIETNEEQVGCWYRGYTCNFIISHNLNQLSETEAGNCFWPKDPKNIADSFCNLFKEPLLKNEDGSLRTRILTKNNVVSFMRSGVFDTIIKSESDPEIVYYFRVVMIQDIVYFFAELKNDVLMINDFIAVTFDEEAKKFIRQNPFTCTTDKKNLKEEDKKKLLEMVEKYFND